MNQRRQVLLVFLAVAVVTATVYWTGAFSDLGAERTSQINVASDDQSFVAITPSDGPNGAYAQQSGGSLQVKLDGGLGQGGGLNPDAETELENIFVITNRGTKPVDVWLVDESDTVEFLNSDGDSIEGKSSAVTIDTGSSVAVGVRADTQEIGNSGLILDSITVHATSEGLSDPPGEGGTGDTSPSDTEVPTADDDDQEAPTPGDMDRPEYGAPPTPDNDGGDYDISDISGPNIKNVGSYDVDDIGKEDFEDEVGKWKEKVDQGAEKAKNVVGSIFDGAKETVKNSTDIVINGISDIIGAIEGVLLDWNSDDYCKKYNSKIVKGAISTVPGSGPLVATAYDDVVDYHCSGDKQIKMTSKFTLGMILGQTGQKDGRYYSNPVIKKISTSVEYYAGWIIPSLIPIVGIVPDARDAIQAGANGDAVGTAVSALGAATGVGSAAKLGPKIAKIAKSSGMVKKVDPIIDAAKKLPDQAPKNVGEQAWKFQDKIQKLENAGFSPQVARQMQHVSIEKASNLKAALNAKGYGEEAALYVARRAGGGSPVTLKDATIIVENGVSPSQLRKIPNSKFADAAEAVATGRVSPDDVIAHYGNGNTAVEAWEFATKAEKNAYLTDTFGTGLNTDTWLDTRAQSDAQNNSSGNQTS